MLKLGFKIVQSSIAKYMIKRRGIQPGMANLLA
jgi:hypothetical protein